MRAVVYSRANFEPIVAVDIYDPELEVLRAGDPIAIAVPVDAKPLYGRFAYRRVPLYAEFVMIGMRRALPRVERIERIMLFPLSGDDVQLLHEAFPRDQDSIKVISTGPGWISRGLGPLSAIKLPVSEG